MIDIRNYIIYEDIPSVLNKDTFPSRGALNQADMIFANLAFYKKFFREFYEMRWPEEKNPEQLYARLDQYGLTNAFEYAFSYFRGCYLYFLAPDSYVSNVNAEFLLNCVSSINIGCKNEEFLQFHSILAGGEAEGYLGENRSTGNKSQISNYLDDVCEKGPVNDTTIEGITVSISEANDNEISRVAFTSPRWITYYYNPDEHPTVYHPYGEMLGDAEVSIPSTLARGGKIDTLGGGMQCFTDARKLAYWVYDEDVPSGIPLPFPNKPGMAYPPTDQLANNPEYLSIPGWTIPPLRQRLQFQNYCFNVPNLKFLKGK